MKLGVALLAGVVIGTSCEDPTGIANVTSVVVTPKTWTFTSLGDTVRFTAAAANARGEAIPGHSFVWRAEPAGVLDIGSDGLARAIGPGTARVSATTDTISGAVEITVAQKVVSVVSVTVPFRFTALGDSMQFGVEARDAGRSEVKGTTFTYRSSNGGVVSVSTTGSMQAVSPGNAYVVATAFGQSDSMLVQVRQDVATVVMSPDTAMIREGTTRQFTAVPKDRNGYVITGRSTVWAVTDSRVVTVNGTGLATSNGRRLGPDTVTATIDGVVGKASAYLFAPFIAVSAFGERTCAVTALGRPYCWGLLNGAAGERSELPLAVSGAPPLSTIAAGGADLSCGLANDGTAFCWPPAALPAASAVSSTVKFASQSVGSTEVYGLTSAGAAYSWSTQAPTPTLFPGGLSFATISAGWQNGCGTVSSGAAYCWGSNIYGALGDSTLQDRVSPTPVRGGLAFAMISAGGSNTCGITTSGTTYCWGANGGAFGDGTTTSSLIPAPAAGNLALTSITVTGNIACGLVASGAAYCWGSNDDGEVGDGSYVRRLSPVPVAGGLTFASLSTGGLHTCGLTTNGALYCWGRNDDRELGDGTATWRAVPTRVGGSRP